VSDLDTLMRVHARCIARSTGGEINESQLELATSDLARWSAEQYARLPQAQAVDAIMGLLLGERK
jgi:hypothetical protein